jgi:SET domain-containing protein
MTKTARQKPPLYIIRRSGIHGRGVFARRDIKKGEKIIEYVGDKLTKAESDKRASMRIAQSKKSGGGAVYIFVLNSRWDIDGNVSWNPARLINHSCDPNCQAYEVRGHIWIYARRAIKAGEELSYNYGFDLEHWEEHPCRCGAKQCVGHIVDRKHWSSLAKLKRKKAATEA